MEHPIVPARITIDFRDSVDPRRAWIVGVADTRSRLELLAFEPGSDADRHPLDRAALPIAVLQGDCTCPEFCERDHANE